MLFTIITNFLVNIKVFKRNSISPNIFKFRDIPDLNKLFLICSLSLMVISIFIGFLQYIIDYRFFKEQVNSKERIINKIYHDKFSNFKEYENFIDEESKKNKTESSNIPLILQSIFILLGIVLFIITIFNIIY